ncbi:DUF2877 domain-containing protein [Alloiococcus sp. CFN-8]|uniref:DUF2877 domain-containing protein n=1 Tax=Alloiococcus sp. CFN-8 TaxID=3416081 RepID=UPI003CEB9649
MSLNVQLDRETMSSLLSLYDKEQAYGRIQSIFNNSFNIEFPEGLIHIGLVGGSLSSYGININKDIFNKLIGNCTIGDIVVYNKKIFTFYTIEGIINLDTKEIKKVELKIPLVDQEIAPKDTLIYKQLNNIDFYKYIGLSINNELAFVINTLTLNCSNENYILKEAINYLVGRGKGLTPSGDDILMGYILALKAYKKEGNIERLLIPQLNRTTIVSKSYYSALFKGYISSDLVTLIEYFEERDISKVNQAIRRVQAIGHTSGYDMLFGFYLGLKNIIIRRS